MDNPIKETIVLAGGLGTRLQEAIGELPKPLAPIQNKPFLHYLLLYLQQQGITTAVLSVGHKWEMIKKAIGDEYLGIKIKYVIEDEPLGTGGGIKHALTAIEGENCFVLNGDTYFDIDLHALAEFHESGKAVCSIAAKSLENFDRYGTMNISQEEIVTAFNEKQPTTEGIINGGIYCINKKIIEQFPDKSNFSFENEFLEPSTASGQIKAKIFQGFFKDIGIPADYEAFNEEMAAPNLSDLPIDKTWTLFLDRDGVINERLIDDYVKLINELSIIEGVPEAIAQFSKQFGRILVVTNQQGIGKGIMDESDLELIHGYMNNVFENHGGTVDQFYFAPQLAREGSNYRKPGTGMGLHAQEDFPEIDFSKSIMIGDSESDIEFGMKLGMKTVMLTNVRNISTKADYIFNNLQSVAKELKK